MNDNFIKDIEQFQANILHELANVQGCLTDREVRFLALIAAYPTGEGCILEIGSFKGRSTVILGKANSMSANSTLVCVDPLEPTSTTDPYESTGSYKEDFERNIEEAGLREVVEFHQCLSQDLAKDWKRNIRLLWIDGDHHYTGTKSDFDLFSPWLADGAIIAFHDVMNGYSGPIRVFMEDVLLSDHFCAAGVCGSIGWAQYRKNAQATAAQERIKLKLYKGLARMIPFTMFTKYFAGKSRVFHHKMLRWFVPHAEPAPQAWIASLA